jgi:hypothetical protein
MEPPRRDSKAASCRARAPIPRRMHRAQCMQRRSMQRGIRARTPRNVTGSPALRA